MIRIQKLKEPKKTSGKKLPPGEEMLFKGLWIRNTNDYPVFVDWYKRKAKKK